jgi:hypothetical protein
MSLRDEYDSLQKMQRIANYKSIEVITPYGHIRGVEFGH